MDDAIAAIRSFNRFYTQRVGALDARFLGSDLSLAEARLLFEIAHAEAPIATNLRERLDMDAGFVSRVLHRFESRGWIVRERAGEDTRRRPIALTPAGHKVFESIDRRQRAEVESMLRDLHPTQQQDLVTALGMTRALLDPTANPGYVVRVFRPGDMGLIAARQSLLYKEAYGWGREIEIIEGEVTTAFLRNFKPGREQCWVAEIDGVMAGSIFLTDEGDRLARLRLFYVEPFARGRGIGNALVSTCLTFAREVGYASVTLWTHTVLDSARRIYAAHGFRLVETRMHDDFGTPVQGETWRLDIAPAKAQKSA